MSLRLFFLLAYFLHSALLFLTWSDCFSNWKNASCLVHTPLITSFSPQFAKSLGKLSTQKKMPIAKKKEKKVS